MRRWLKNAFDLFPWIENNADFDEKPSIFGKNVCKWICSDKVKISGYISAYGLGNAKIGLICDIKMDVSSHVEAVVLLSKLKADHHIEVELNTDELDLTSAESKATYDEIKAYVKEHTGLTVSSLNIAQVKQKYGIIERENYNKAKSKDSRQPKCPKEKEEAIVEALRYFKMM